LKYYKENNSTRKTKQQQQQQQHESFIIGALPKILLLAYACFVVESMLFFAVSLTCLLSAAAAKAT